MVEDVDDVRLALGIVIGIHGIFLAFDKLLKHKHFAAHDGVGKNGTLLGEVLVDVVQGGLPFFLAADDVHAHAEEAHGGFQHKRQRQFVRIETAQCLHFHLFIIEIGINLLANAAERGLVLQNLDLFHQFRLWQLGIEPNQGVFRNGIELMGLVVFLHKLLVVQQIKAMPFYSELCRHFVVQHGNLFFFQIRHQRGGNVRFF